jgi:hypothetical protein
LGDDAKLDAYAATLVRLLTSYRADAMSNDLDDEANLEKADTTKATSDSVILDHLKVVTDALGIRMVRFLGTILEYCCDAVRLTSLLRHRLRKSDGTFYCPFLVLIDAMIIHCWPRMIMVSSRVAVLKKVLSLVDETAIHDLRGLQSAKRYVEDVPAGHPADASR